ncbi:MAG: tetratricopeptide repeat protein [Burkholderiaceae bacterium]|nr:tetratricopeptide repeat protein [Burkholderiaceae bacterium]
MSDDTDKYDFFVSYAGADNKDEKGRPVNFFLAQLEAAFERLFGRKPEFFSDKTDIGFGRDWGYILNHGMAASRFFLVFVSPHYLDCEMCRREWRAWIDKEIGRGTLGQGMWPIFVAHVDGWTNQAKDKLGDQEVAEKIAEWGKWSVSDTDYVASVSAVIKQLRSRNYVTAFLPFFSEGVNALRRNEMRGELEKLAKDFERQAHLVTAAVSSSENNVPPYSRYFSGRVDELNQLRAQLGSERIGVVSGIHGLGGIGKTELALTYAHAYAYDYPGGRFYVPCEHASGLQQAVLCLERDVNEINADIDDQERKDADALFAAIQRSMRKRLASKGRVLLVLENVTDIKLVSTEQTALLTGLGADLHLLFTTRLAPPLDSEKWLMLEEFSDTDALVLLEKHCPFTGDADRLAARHIVHRLGGLTFAVELIGAYLADTPESGYGVLADELGQEEGDDDLAAVVGQKRIVMRRHRHERRLSAALAIVLQNLSPPQRRALEYAALLPPDGVALPWLRELVGRDFTQALRPTHQIADPWRNLLDCLFRRALLRPGQDGSEQEPKVARMHRLLQGLLLRYRSENDRAVWQWGLDKLIEERLAALQVGAIPEANRWEVQSLAALAQLWADRQHPQAALLLDAAALRLHDLAAYSEAEPLYRRALAVAEANHGAQHPEVARNLNNLARLLEDTRMLQEAESLYRRALAINETSQEQPHPNVSISLNNIARLLQATDRPQEAELLYRRALEINEACYGLWHPSVVASLGNLAQLLAGIDRLQEAERLIRRSLEITEATYGPQHPNTAQDLGSLAKVLQAAGRPQEAGPLYRRALAIDEAHYGSEHPAVAMRLNDLAQLLQAAKQVKQAGHLFRRALEIAEASLGAEHPGSVTLRNSLADTLRFSRRIFMLGLIWMFVIGVVAGVIAWQVMPGSQHMGWVKAGALGIAGSFVGGLIARLLSKPAEGSSVHLVGILLSIMGAATALVLYGYLGGHQGNL